MEHANMIITYVGEYLDKVCMLIECDGRHYRVFVNQYPDRDTTFLPQYIAEDGDIEDFGDFDKMDFTWEEVVDIIVNDK